MKNNIFLTVTIASALLSCEQTIDPFEDSNKKFLTDGVWATKKITPSTGWTIAYVEYDNRFTFNTNGNLTIDFGDLRFGDTNQQTVTWEADKKITNIDVFGWSWGPRTNTWVIDVLTVSTLTFHIKFKTSSGEERTVYYELEKEIVSKPQYATALSPGKFVIKAMDHDSFLVWGNNYNIEALNNSIMAWNLVPSSNGNYFIQPEWASNINIDEVVAESKVIVYWAHGGDNQQWSFEAVGDGKFRIKNRQTNKFITSVGVDQAMVTSSSSSNAQLFRLYPI